MDLLALLNAGNASSSQNRSGSQPPDPSTKSSTAGAAATPQQPPSSNVAHSQTSPVSTSAPSASAQVTAETLFQNLLAGVQSPPRQSNQKQAVSTPTTSAAPLSPNSVSQLKAGSQSPHSNFLLSLLGRGPPAPAEQVPAEPDELNIDGQTSPPSIKAESDTRQDPVISNETALPHSAPDADIKPSDAKQSKKVPARPDGLSSTNAHGSDKVHHLDLSRSEAAGPGSLYPAKLEVSHHTLLEAPCVPAVKQSGGVSFDAPRIGSLAGAVLAYSLHRGKVRILDVATGERLVLRGPNKEALNAFWAIEAGKTRHNEPQCFFAAITEPDTKARESLCFWRIVEREGRLEEEFIGQLRGSEQSKDSSIVHTFSWTTRTDAASQSVVSAAWVVSARGKSAHSTIVVRDFTELVKVFAASIHPADAFQQALDREVIQRRSISGRRVAGHSFSQDGSLYATIRLYDHWAPDYVYEMHFETVDPSNDRLDAAILSLPLLPKSATGSDGRPEISFFALISDPTQAMTTTTHSNCPRAAIVGFSNNRLLALVDLEKRQWRHVWSFTGMKEKHFNLAKYHTDSASLVVANSQRSSLFVQTFDFSSLPPTRVAKLPSKSDPNEAQVLHHRLTSPDASAGLPWSLKEPRQWREFHIPDPCVSIDIQQEDLASLAVNAAHTKGISTMYVPIALEREIESHLDDAETAGAADQVAQAESSVAPQETSPVQQAEQPAPAGPELDTEERAEQVDSQPSVPEKLAPASTDVPSISEAAANGDIEKQADPAPQAPDAKVQGLPQGKVELDTADYTSQHSAEVSASASGERSKRNKKKRSKAGLQSQKPIETTPAPPAASTEPADSTSTSVPSMVTEMRSLLQAMEARIDQRMDVLAAKAAKTASSTSGGTTSGADSQSLVSSSGAPPSRPASPRLTGAALSAIADEVATSLRGALSETVRSELNDVLRSIAATELKAGIESAVQEALPGELHHLLTQASTVNMLTRSISAGVVSMIQKTVVEVSSKVLAPHFEQTLQSVFERLEARVESSMTGVRKSIVAEQSTALVSSEVKLAEVTNLLSSLNTRMDAMQEENASLRRTLDQVAATQSRGSVQAPVPSSAVSDYPPEASFHRQTPSQNTQMSTVRSPWTPVEPFRPNLAGGEQHSRAQSQSLQSQSQSPAHHAPHHFNARHDPGWPSSAEPAAMPASSPSVSTPAPGESVEDQLLTALTAEDDGSSLMSTLSHLSTRYGHPNMVLQLPINPHQDRHMGCKSRVSQPVLLALLIKLSKTIVCFPPSAQYVEAPIIWSEAAAEVLDPRDASLTSVGPQHLQTVRGTLEQKWRESQQLGVASWWTRPRLENQLLRYLA